MAVRRSSVSCLGGPPLAVDSGTAANFGAFAEHKNDASIATKIHRAVHSGQGNQSAGRTVMDSRNQTRWLSVDGAPRWVRCALAHRDWLRLDRTVCLDR